MYIFRKRAHRKQLKLADDLRNRVEKLKSVYEAAYWMQPDKDTELKSVSMVQMSELLDRIDHHLGQDSKAVLGRVVVDHLISIKRQCDYELKQITISPNRDGRSIKKIRDTLLTLRRMEFRHF